MKEDDCAAELLQQGVQLGVQCRALLVGQLRHVLGVRFGNMVASHLLEYCQFAEDTVTVQLVPGVEGGVT